MCPCIVVFVCVGQYMYSCVENTCTLHNYVSNFEQCMLIGDYHEQKECPLFSPV